MRHLTFREALSSTVSILVIIALGVTAVVSVYNFVSTREREALIERSALVAASFDPSEVKLLTGTSADLANPTYLSIKQRLMNMRAVNADVRFVYLTAYRDGKIIFLIDSEDPNNAADYSPPGQTYDEASQNFYNAFEHNQSFLEEPLSDRWGNWVSSLSPLVDPTTGAVISVIGVDIDARTYYSSIIFYSLIPIIITLALVLIAIANRTIASRERENVHLRSEFIAVASHELRAPITGIKWVLQVLNENGSNLTDQQKTSIGNVMQHCERLLGTIGNILDIAALERGKLALSEQTSCNLYEIVHEAADNLEYVAKERRVTLQFIGEWNAMGDEIICDKNRMRMAFANLLSNAIKYSAEGGNVDIMREKTKKGYRVTITDHGIGIPQTDHEKVFRGFFRSRNAIHATPTGTGLGLYYSKAIVEMHRGSISLTSDENKGTSVFVDLPAA